MSHGNYKKEYLNLMRAFAIIFVVFNHTGSDVFFSSLDTNRILLSLY